MAITTLTASISPTVAISAKGPAPSAGLNPRQGGGQYTCRSSAVGTAAANAAKGGADEAASFLVSLAASGNTTIDLTTFTDILGTTAVALVRLKAIQFELLAVGDDPTNAPTPNSTNVTVGGSGANDWVSQTGTGGPSAATWGIVIPSGGRFYFDVGPDSAGGSTVDATHKLIKLTNNDAVGGHTAVIRVTLFGGTT